MDISELTSNLLYFILIIIALVIFITAISYALSSRKRFDDSDLYRYIRELENKIESLERSNSILKQQKSSLSEDLELCKRGAYPPQQEHPVIHERPLVVDGTTASTSTIHIQDKIQETNKSFSDKIKPDLSNNIENRIYVQFDYSSLNGDVKSSDNPKMFLQKENATNDFELHHSSEIVVKSPVELQEIELCYIISNPKQSNTKPLIIESFPKYEFDLTSGKGRLLGKGRLTYK